MTDTSRFRKYIQESFDSYSPKTLLSLFGESHGLQNLASVATSVSMKRSTAYITEVVIEDAKLTVTKDSKAGLNLPQNSIIKLVKDTPMSELVGSRPWKGRLTGILPTSVQSFQCDTKETCPSCKGDRECQNCKAVGDVVCDMCHGDGGCRNCAGSGKEGCPDCDGNGNCATCKGSGKVDCIVCNGDGLCDICKGSGDCTVCDGTASCQHCDGTGDCQECGGDGTVTCQWCWGDGTESCGDCCGTGIYIDRGCNKCSGYGKLYRNGREKTCDVCHGSGRYIVECHRCKGTGRVRCSNCNGKGDFRCDDCHGSGRCVECNGSGNCRACYGNGTCVKCRGTKKCQRCDGRGDFWCKSCRRHDGKCIGCDGTGEINCTGCGGSLKCGRCDGDGRVTCPNCGGSKTCPDCMASGQINCKRCEGQGWYQTFEKYSINTKQRSFELADSIDPFTREDISCDILYDGVFKLWKSPGRIEIDNSNAINAATGDANVSRCLIEWMEKKLTDDIVKGYFNYRASCRISRYDVVTVHYMVANKGYSFSIGGRDKQTVYYDSLPGVTRYILTRMLNILRK